MASKYEDQKFTLCALLGTTRKSILERKTLLRRFS